MTKYIPNSNLRKGNIQGISELESCIGSDRPILPKSHPQFRSIGAFFLYGLGSGNVNFNFLCTGRFRVELWFFRIVFKLIRHFKRNSWIYFNEKTIYLNIKESMCFSFLKKKYRIDVRDIRLLLDNSTWVGLGFYYFSFVSGSGWSLLDFQFTIFIIGFLVVNFFYHFQIGILVDFKPNFQV